MAYTGSIAPITGGAKSPAINGYADGHASARQNCDQNNPNEGQTSFYDMFCASLKEERTELQGMLQKVEENNNGMKEAVQSFKPRNPAFAAPTVYEWGLTRRHFIEIPVLEIPMLDVSGQYS